MKIRFSDREEDVLTASEAMSKIYNSMTAPTLVEYEPSEENEASTLNEMLTKYCQNLRIKKPVVRLASKS